MVTHFRSKPAARVSTTSNGSTSLLANVSFTDEADEDDTQKNFGSYNDLSTVGLQRRLNKPRTERPKSTCNMSNSYQKLLDRSNDLESPLKQFAQKHGFQLGATSTPHSEDNDQPKSLSPTDLSSSEFTKVTPRSDCNQSPPLHTAAESRDLMSITGQSYVVSTALTAEIAEAAGIPVIRSGVNDSCTEVSFTSLADNGSDKSTESPRVTVQSPSLSSQPANGQFQQSPRNGSRSPIQPIEISEGSDTGSVTSFVGMGMAKVSDVQQSLDISAAAQPTTGLKQRFQQQKTAPAEGNILCNCFYTLAV